MIIPIGKDYRLTSDALNLVLQKRGEAGSKAKTPGAETWKTASYHNLTPDGLGLALHRVIASELHGSEAESFSAMLGKLEAIREMITAALRDIGDIAAAFSGGEQGRLIAEEREGVSNGRAQ